MIQEGGKKIKKKKKKVAPKNKGKGKQVPKQNTPKIKVSASSDCYYCNGKGHWKRNCPKYLADLKSGIASKASTSGIFVIEVNVTVGSIGGSYVTRKYNSELVTEHKLQP